MDSPSQAIIPDDDMKKVGVLRSSYRFLVVVFMLGATFMSYVLRVNINIAVVDMVVGDSAGRNACARNPNQSYVDLNGRYQFCWSDSEKQLVLGAFFYGYFVLQIPGGALAEKIGAKAVLGWTVFLTALLALVTPTVAFQGPAFLIALRVVQGLLSGVTYPALPPLIKRWSYAAEMGKFISIAYVGGTFGTALTYPLGGFILQHYSWDVLFYVTGGMAIVWFVLWTIFVSNDPSENKFIGSYEKTQIIRKRLRFTTTASLVPPMHKILAVPTIWICALSEFGYSIALYFVIIEGPTFIKEVLGKNIQQNGILNALPSLSAFAYAQVFGFTSDLIDQMGLLSKPNIMRTFEGISMVVPAIGCFLMTRLITSDWRIVIGILCVLFGTRTGNYIGRNRLYYEVFPDHSGPAFGFVNMVGSIAGFVTPQVTGALTGGHESDPSGWITLFYIAMAMQLGPYLLFLLFARFSPVPMKSTSQDEERRKSVPHEEKCYDNHLADTA